MKYIITYYLKYIFLYKIILFYFILATALLSI